VSREALQEAVDTVGGQSELGRLIGVKQQRISKWLLLSKEEVPPGEFVRLIVDAVRSKGRDMSPHKLRGDLYPEGFEFPSEQRQEAVG
jgi:DNA-binding transcriptional regulator YdaS (Cro superfamily)